MKYLGFDVIISDFLPPKVVYDWSQCRAPSRAKRRYERGIKTRVVIKAEPNNSVYMVGRKAIMSRQAYLTLVAELEKNAPCLPASSPGLSSPPRMDMFSTLFSPGFRANNFIRGDITS